MSAKSAAAGDGEGLVRIDIFPSIVGVEEYQLLVPSGARSYSCHWSLPLQVTPYYG